MGGELPCAICRRPVPPRPDNPAWPFCSPRCRLIDLGKWLDGDYRLSSPEDEIVGDPDDA